MPDEGKRQVNAILIQYSHFAATTRHTGHFTPQPAEHGAEIVPGRESQSLGHLLHTQPALLQKRLSQGNTLGIDIVTGIFPGCLPQCVVEIGGRTTCSGGQRLGRGQSGIASLSRPEELFQPRVGRSQPIGLHLTSGNELPLVEAGHVVEQQPHAVAENSPATLVDTPA